MSVSLAPSNALGFNRPLTTLVKRSLTITNHNAQPVAFKLYTVRPNSGRVEPGQSVDVLVMSQPLKDEPPLNAKCKDKFLIQSTLITPGKEAMSLQDIWANPDTNEEGKVHQQKLRVVYLPAEGQTLVEEDEEALANMSSMMTSGDMHRYDTVRQHPSTNGATTIVAPDPAPEASRAHTPPADFSNAHEEPHEEIHPSFEAPGVVVTPPEPVATLPSVREPTPEPSPAPAPASAPVPVAAPVPVVAAASFQAPSAPVSRKPSVPTPVIVPAPLPPAPAPTDEYATKYADAQAEIERLRKLLAESQPPAELRRRSRKLSDATAVDVAVLEEAAIQEGVPLQVVVIIALGVFITTYLFF
ncbi:MSP domain-containing protein [Mycena sanguinolenta]|uniref:MSP domain-containing protein n=1 Tax=Mycena sanguinolenta TaxID=230812 RepID=A0A8H7CQG6_9AGAR|nr:MSP domain-containing protein [Mycena sanguinolenta]